MDPVKPTRKRRYTKTDVQYLNENEIEALFTAIRDGGSVRDLAIFEFAYHRGLRAGEVRLHQLADWNIAARTMYVRRLKGGNSGEYELTDREQSSLTAYLAQRGNAPGALFPSRKGTPISRQRLHEMINAYGATCGLVESKRHFHCLRHTAATMLVDHMDVVDVQDHLGHRDIRSTMVYTKIRSKRRRDRDRRMASEW